MLDCVTLGTLRLARGAMRVTKVTGSTMKTSSDDQVEWLLKQSYNPVLFYSLELGSSDLVDGLAGRSLGSTGLARRVQTGVDLLGEGRLVDVARGNRVKISALRGALSAEGR